MRYFLSFTKAIAEPASSSYINDCCRGGDVIRDYLLPQVEAAGYAKIETGQEDWVWYIWFFQGQVRLEINIYCDDMERGEFRIWLVSKVRKRLFLRYVDRPELEPVKDLVFRALSGWASEVRVEQEQE